MRLSLTFLLCAIVFLLPVTAMGYSIGNFNTYQSAWVAPPGKIDIGFGSGIVHENDGGYENIYFVPDVWMGKGMQGGIELGVRGAPFAVGVNLKARIHSTATTALAICPMVAFSYLSGGGSSSSSASMAGITFALPLLIGIKLAEHADVTFGPKILYDLNAEQSTISLFGSTTSMNSTSGLLYIGGFLGLSLHLGDFTVTPEISVYHGQSRSEGSGFSSYSERTFLSPGVGFSLVF